MQLRPVGRNQGGERKRQGGFTLIGAIISTALLVSLGMVMMSLTVEFHRMRNESLAGTQLNLVADTLLIQYWREGMTGQQEAQFYVTRNGLCKADSSNEGQGPPEGWMDTIKVLLWSEDIGTGKRLWAMVRSERSRRSACAVRFARRPNNIVQSAGQGAEANP